MIRLFCVVVLFALIAISHGFQIQPRVLNGVLSNPQDYKYYVLLMSRDSSCGGALISDRWVLTAAHCIVEKMNMRVYYGVAEAGLFKGNIDAPPSNMHVYPEFDSWKKRHDIGLIELPTPITLDASVQPVNLMVAADFPHSGGMYVIGAGTGMIGMFTKNRGYRLREATLETISSEYCSSRTINKLDPNTILCGNVTEAQQALFEGDSGGPVISKATGQLIGLSSFSSRSRTAVFIDIYTYVPYYHAWIERKTGLKVPKINGPQAGSIH